MGEVASLAPVNNETLGEGPFSVGKSEAVSNGDIVSPESFLLAKLFLGKTTSCHPWKLDVDCPHIGRPSGGENQDGPRCHLDAAEDFNTQCHNQCPPSAGGNFDP